MEENGETKHKRKILWISLGIFLMILIAGVFIVGLPPSLNENAGNEIAIPEPPPNRPTPIVITPWYLLPHIDIGDGGLITKDPCGPPCFFGIIPGETSKAEVWEIIKETGLNDDCEERSGWKVETIVCGEYFLVDFPEEGNIVTGIGFVPSQYLKLGDLIDKYGMPDRAFVLMGEIPDAPQDYNMWIFFDKIYTQVSLYTQEGGNKYNVSENTGIQGIYYFDNEGYSGDLLYINSSKWKGYGEYEGEWFPNP